MQRKKQRNAAADNAAVIRLAVEYAQAVAAWHGGFKADPDGDSTTAAKAGKHLEQADLALQKLAARPATSAEALDAKARVAPIALDHEGGSLSDPADKFFRSFAADVCAFLKPAIHKEWMAKKDQAA
jgi:hypothetical protein